LCKFFAVVGVAVQVAFFYGFGIQTFEAGDFDEYFNGFHGDLG
jgi:hypothetical protein